MSLTLDLTPEIEKRLTEKASRLGVSPAEYVERVLGDQLNDVGTCGTGAELVAYWEREGVIGIWADRDDIKDSSDYAAFLRRLAEQRVRGATC